MRRFETLNFFPLHQYHRRTSNVSPVSVLVLLLEQESPSPRHLSSPFLTRPTPESIRIGEFFNIESQNHWTDSSVSIISHFNYNP